MWTDKPSGTALEVIRGSSTDATMPKPAAAAPKVANTAAAVSALSRCPWYGRPLGLGSCFFAGPVYSKGVQFPGLPMLPEHPVHDT